MRKFIGVDLEFKELAELCDKLEATSKRGEMVDLVAGFLRKLQPDEVEPAVSMLLGRPVQKWSSKTLEVSWATLHELIFRITRVKPQEFAAAFSKTGDLGAATAMIFESSRRRRQAVFLEKPLTILDVKHLFEKIAQLKGPGVRERKERLLESTFSRATPQEAKCLMKIIIKETRTGFQEGLMELSIAKTFGVPQEAIRRATMFVGDVAVVARVAKVKGEEGVRNLRLEVFKPIKPMLAQNVDGIENALKIHRDRTAFEQKIDGARVQIHKSDDEVKIFSRRLTDVTESIPEIVESIRKGAKVRDAILEGEVVALDKTGRPMPFQYILKRFRRERDVGKMVREVPLGLYLFDLLYLDGDVLVDLGYLERRKKLSQITRLPLTKQLITANLEDAKKFLEEALAEGHEGLMAKELASPYAPGMRGKLWLKIKPVLEPLDLVIVAAEYGYGRRHNWLSDYYLAARDSDTGEFMIVGKTFKGLTDEEIIEMTRRLKQLVIKMEVRRVIVAPRIVVEVSYNEIQRSPKYKCGMALRFARITRIRDDKGPEDADTIQRVRKIFEMQVKKHL
jgi:DNA ligase-1